ncbi:MAG: hypothetical protein P1U86_13220 [Verrucomicrobiales bacterium]|nr:hypothetical protein [Verrucomicrobiales bacterium]
MIRPLHSSALILLGFSTILLSSCDSELQGRVDRLEAELRGIRSDTRDEVGELKNRVIAAETSVGVSSDGLSITDRIAALEAATAPTGGSTSNKVVYLRPNLQGHAPIETDHGVFLVRMEGIDLNNKTGTFIVHLNIGNPHAVAIQQFVLKGDHGGGTPELEEGEEYSLTNPKIKEWQKTLKPFQFRVSKTLEPFAWTPFDIELAAESREELEMIRFSLLIENARLNRRSADGSTSDQDFAHIKVGSKAASVLKTEYGAFLVSVKKTEKTEVGTRVHLEIGNPYGFTINQCRLVGDYGPKIPAREDSPSPEEFAKRMKEWGAALEPFESMISSKVANFRWNRTTILVPSTTGEVGFLRCQLRVEDVTLPAATDKQ